jgi:predicted nucleic acid-binding Zn ribbon protein
MTSSKSESKKPKDSAPDINERTGRIANPIDLSSDPDYTKLLKHYQHAEFTKCKEVLDKLEKRYPEHPGLLKFKDDLQMKLSLKNIENSIKKGEKSKKKKAILNMSVFAIIVMIVFFFSYYYTNDIITVKQLEDETALLTSLNYQAEQLLLARQPQPAAEIIERIRTINPEFVNLPELISLTDDLLRLEANYQTALNLITANCFDRNLLSNR